MSWLPGSARGSADQSVKQIHYHLNESSLVQSKPSDHDSLQSGLVDQKPNQSGQRQYKIVVTSIESSKIYAVGEMKGMFFMLSSPTVIVYIEGKLLLEPRYYYPL